jgi:hypothetical protein
MRVRRFDIGELKKPVRQENGWLRVEGHLTRTGVFEYRNPDGSVRREYRPPDEVFRADSLASFNAVPLTNGHPPEGLLTAENTGRYQVGTVLGPSADGPLMRAEILVTDAATIKEMEAGRVCLSNGYTAELDPTPGVTPEGERYDGVQRAIVGNHVALVSAPRAGEVARVRMDSADAAMIAYESESDSPSESTVKTRKIRIDSVEVEVEETVAALVEKAQTEAATALKAAQDSEQAAKARADSVEADLKKAQAQIAEMPAKVKAEIVARVALEGQAREVLGTEVRLDGKSDREVKAEVLGKLAPDFKVDGRPDAYVDAAFDLRVAAWRAEDPAAVVARQANATVHTDEIDDDALAKAEAAFREAAAKKLLRK